MNTHSGHQPIVACVDGSMPALNAVRWGAAEAARRRMPLRLVHAHHPLAADPRRHSESLGERPGDLGLQWLREAATIAQQTAPAVEWDSRVRSGDPATELLAESQEARLIVAGARGSGGFPGLELGSVALALATSGRCPAVIVRDRPLETGPVVVGVTGSPLCQAALGYAFDQADGRAESLIAVHAWHPLPTDAELAAAMGIAWADLEAEQDELLAQWLSDGLRQYPGVRVTRVIATSRAARALLDHSRFAQLVVVGCHGRSPLTGLVLGAVPRALLHQASCPVMVVRDGHHR